MSDRVSLAVYTRAGVQVASTDFLGADGKPTWMPAGEGPPLYDELDDTGSFGIRIQADAVDLDDVEAGHIFVVLLDAVPIWRGVIRQLRRQEIGVDNSDAYTVLLGSGEVARLDELKVYPPGGLGRYPFPDERTFNWTAYEFDDSGWSAAVVTAANYGATNENYGLPEGFPWGTAGWIWDVDSSTSVPATVEYLRKKATVPELGVYQAWGAADDRFEAWIDTKSILKSSDAPYDGTPYPVELLMTANAVQVAAKAENRNTLKAGLLFGIGRPQEDGEAPFVVTDATWLVAPNGAELGMNPGQILTQLRTEGIARGETWPAVTFTAALDSNGVAWSTYEELTVQVGDSVWDVLKQMVDLEMCDFRMSPDGFELNVYNAGTAGSLVAYTLGSTNLTHLSWDITPSVATALLVRWGRGWTDVDHDGLVTANGRRTELLTLGGVWNETAAEIQAMQVIRKLGYDRVEISAGVQPEDATKEPYTLYGPGDLLTAPAPGTLLGWNDGVWNDGNWNEDAPGATPVRVMAVGMGVDDTGQPTWDIHLNTHIEEQAKRQQIMLKKLAAGTAGGRSQAATLPYEPRPIQPREPEPVIFSQTGGAVIETSGPHTFTRAVRVREVHVEVSPASTSGDVVVAFKKNGTTFATVTVASGRGASYQTASTIFVQRADILTVSTTSVGTGVESVTAKVVYA